MRLLEKVEELTLYTLQQQEQLEALRVQNEEPATGSARSLSPERTPLPVASRGAGSS